MGEKTKRKTVFFLIPILLFVAFIAFFMIRTVQGGVRETLAETEVSTEGFETLSDSFEEVLQEEFYAKNAFLDLNGFSARVLGINSLNERQKLANGYLALFEKEEDTDYDTNGVIEMNRFLSERGIPFLFILAPGKASFYDAEFAPGYGSDAWKNIDAMIDALDGAGVPCLDMDAWFEENGWAMEDVFFKTDHHWLPEAGFQAAKLTMEYLSGEGDAVYDPATLQEDNWTVTVLPDWSLGSDGKRTGTAYAGVDDFSVYSPNYETDYSYSYLRFNSAGWVYKDSPLNLSYLDHTDYFNDSVNSLYLYNNYPLTKLTNADAVNDGSILVIGDSFRLPYEYFLSTQFTEVYGFDVRNYTDGTLAQYIGETQPDIVVMLTAVSEISDVRLYTFGVSSYLDALNETGTARDLGDIAVAAGDGEENRFAVVCSDPEPGRTYTLTVDSTAYEGGEDSFIQMTLQDLTTNKAVANRYFDAKSAATQKWIFTVPEGSDTYAVYLYAGTKGHTAGVSAQVTGITLCEGVVE